MKKSFLAAPLAALLLASCAQVPPGAGSDPADPWERMNRHTFEFNSRVDSYVIRPVAKGYEAVVPAGVREGVSNVFVNLGEPADAANSALQGKAGNAAHSVFRFLINTVYGLGGFFDVAGSQAGVARAPEDFGQTLAVWGVPDGPYFVIPFLGPSTMRDAPSLAVDWASSPQTWVKNDWIEWPAWGLEAVDLRARMLPATDLLDTSVDPYAMARGAYLSTRRSAVWDGNPPLEDEDWADDPYEEDAASGGKEQQ